MKSHAKTWNDCTAEKERVIVWIFFNLIGDQRKSGVGNIRPIRVHVFFVPLDASCCGRARILHAASLVSDALVPPLLWDYRYS